MEKIAQRGLWLALAAALLGWMFDGFEQGIFPLVARPALVDLLGLSDDARRAADPTIDDSARTEAKQRIDAAVGPWNGGITAAFLIGAACGGWFFGWLGDRAGRVRTMVYSVLTYALFTGLCGLAQSPWHLASLRFLSALGMGGEWALGVALVMECWPEKSRPLLAGLIGASANVGFILTGLLVTVVQAGGLNIAGGGWRWVLAACVFPAIFTFFLRTFVPESEKWKEAASSGPRARIADIFTPNIAFRTLMGTAHRLRRSDRHLGFGAMDSALGSEDDRATAGREQRADVFRSGRGDRLYCRRPRRRPAGAAPDLFLHVSRLAAGLRLPVPLANAVASGRGRLVLGYGDADSRPYGFVLWLAAAVSARVVPDAVAGNGPRLCV